MSVYGHISYYVYEYMLIVSLLVCEPGRKMGGEEKEEKHWNKHERLHLIIVGISRTLKQNTVEREPKDL